MSHDFFPTIRPHFFYCKRNGFVKIHWLKDTQMVTSHSSQQKIALTTCMCILITFGTITCIRKLFPTIRWSQSLQVPSFPLPSGCEAGRGGVHITRRDDLRFCWWIHQVGSALQSDRRGCWMLLGWLKIWRLLGDLTRWWLKFTRWCFFLSWVWMNLNWILWQSKEPDFGFGIFTDGLMPPTRLVASKFL